MARRNLIEKLIDRSEITEELRLIEGSLTDYITPSGEIYKDYGNNKFLHKAQWLNWGYWYCNITYPDGQKQRRVHRLVAQAYIPNPNNYPYVCHKDDDKSHKHMDNLEWGTAAKNTQDAYDRGKTQNAQSWDDSQSIHVACFNLQGELLKKYGSVGEASREIGVTKTAILNQCNHNVKTKPRCGYWFRYLSEYEEKGFVL